MTAPLLKAYGLRPIEIGMRCIVTVTGPPGLISAVVVVEEAFPERDRYHVAALDPKHGAGSLSGDMLKPE